MCLLALFVTITTTAWAYDLVVGGVTVTSSNASGVTGTNIKAFSSGVNGGKPSVVYNNSTKTLTLWNVKIERTGSDNRAILSGISGLTVVLKGNNYLKATGASPVRFNAQTTLKCEVYNGTRSSDIIGGTQDALTVGSGATLTITDADLFLQSSNSSAFDAEGSPTLIIQNSIITAEGGGTNSNDNFGLRNYKELRINNSTVTLQGASQAIKNLTTLTLGTGMFVSKPVSSIFYDKTVCHQNSLKPANPVTFAMGIAINSTNFTDATFRSYVSTKFDTTSPKDGYLSPAEINAAKSMDPINKGIGNLKGIEYFTELTSINLCGNSLQTLDLSKNTKLTYLECILNNLTTLNLSKNTALTEIHCYQNRIRGTGATTFVNNLPTVTNGVIYFYAAESSTGNAMTETQVATAKGKGWTVKWQKKAGDAWSDYPSSDAIAIDATNFPDENFRKYVSSRCDPNKDGYLTPAELKSSTKIDVSDRGIKKLNGIEYFTALTKLYCHSNELSTLDVSKNTALTTLQCFNNKLTSLTLSKNSALRDLTCYVNRLQGTAMDQLIAGLPETTNGEFYVVANTPEEQNDVTSNQVATAKAKGWTTYYWTGGEFIETAGSDAIAIDATNFPDENFRKCLLEQNYGKDGYLTPAELNSITSMNVDGKGIKDLKGIEYFTALTSLGCIDNELGTLDLSKNTALTTLICERNKLTSLDVSKCTALKYLDCYDNSLGTLDVQKNTALYWLNCHNNNIESLDVSKNTALKNLYCHSNALTTLNVSMNTALETLYCYSNALTTLDVSKNSALIILECYSNKLTSLILSNNSAFRYLKCYDNQLQGAAMDQLIAGLRETGGSFYAIAPNIPTEQNVVTTAQVAAAKAKGWTTYCWTGTTWDDYGGQHLPYDGSPVGLAINATNFPDEIFRNWLLAQEYGKDGFLTDEEIAGVKEIDVNGFVTGGTIASLKGIEHFTALTTLNCYFNQITALDLSKNTALTTLLIGSNPLKAMPDLSQNTKLTVLDCSSLGLTKLDVSKLTALTELSCGSNQLKELDLEKLTALTTLNIENNQFETLDVSHNTALTSLNCTNNRLTTIDLSNNKSLKTLFCSVNRISGTGMTALVNSLPVISWTSSSGKIYVVDETNKSEYNICSTVQRAIATSKHWSVYHNNTGFWELYEGSAVEKGDANGDGVIDANDVDALTAYILTGTLPPFVGDTDALDVDGSGTVDIVDLARLIRLTFGR